MSHPPESTPPASFVDSAVGTLLYSLSLPERLVRSAVGVTAGTAKEIAEFVVPQAFQDSKTYEIAIRNSLGFLVSGVGTLAHSKAIPTSDAVNGEPSTATEQSSGRFIARKAAGNFIDIAGLTMLHASPIWVLAIVSDVAYGSQVYLHELAEELKLQGLVDETTSIHNVEDLLGAVKHASGTAASSFDQPPLSLDELQKSLEQTRAALANIDPAHFIPEAEIRRYWSEMRGVAEQEQVSLLGLSGAIAMQSLEAVRGLTQGTTTGLLVAGELFNQRIFGHYVGALTRIQEVGLWASVKSTYAPYIDMTWGNFVSSRKTWTEQILDPGHVGRALNAVSQWWKGEEQAPPPQET